MPECLHSVLRHFKRTCALLLLWPVVAGFLVSNSAAQSTTDLEVNTVLLPRRLFLADSHELLLPADTETAGNSANLAALPDMPEPQVVPITPVRLDLSVAHARFQYTAPPVSALGPSYGGAASAQQSSGSPGYIPTSLALENSDFGNMSINGVDVGVGWKAVQHLMPPGVDLYATEAPIVDPSAEGYGAPGGYQWSGLLSQSLLFNVVENTFRAASDDQIRHMVSNKPFWHDYAASMKQFNMRRWNDGDDFLVNYVGHPMQGAVSGFIEIQNDPVGRQLEISSDPAYWKSRFKAFLWEVAYSTHSEISPIGEAGIGNEGGWTYPINCRQGCPKWNPATMKSTNNTGWVDFIITPTVGSLWMLAEDTLDRFVSDRVQRDDQSNLGAAFLRGALNPSRTMANLMRLQAPWYRDRQHDPEIEKAYIVHVQPTDEELAELGSLRRFVVAPYFQGMPFGNPANPCVVCLASPGVGIGFDIAINRWLDASFTMQRQGGLLGKGMQQSGSTVSYGYGLRFVHMGLRNDLSIAVRPGHVTEEIPQPLQMRPGLGIYYRPEVDLGHTSVTLMLSDDIKINRTMGVRYSIGDRIVRYRNPVEEAPGIGTPPYLSWLSKDDFTNRSNWIAEAGPVLRF